MKGGMLLCGALALALCTGAAGICAAGEEKEEKVSLDSVPAVVKAAIEKETAGGKIDEIEKDERGGAVIYEVGYVKDGKETEVSFAADGKIVNSGGDEREGAKDDREPDDKQDK